MKKSEVRGLHEKSIEELRKSAEELREQLFKLRFQKATGQIENPVKIRTVRKDIARIQTVLRSRLAEAE